MVWRSVCAANLVQLLETDILGVLPEALMAHAKAVLSDPTVSVGAGATSAGALSIFARPGVVDIFETHVDAEQKKFEPASSDLKTKLG